MSLYTRVQKLEAAAVNIFKSYDMLTCKDNLTPAIKYFENEAEIMLEKNEEELKNKPKTKNRIQELKTRAFYILKNLEDVA